jgi:hypothetical protein
MVQMQEPQAAGGAALITGYLLKPLRGESQQSGPKS